MTNGKTPVYSLSLCGRMVLQMHSLNNEGGEGNQIQTRMVTIVHREGDRYRPVTVNAISGDMFKHIQAEHLYLLARQGGLPLCQGCRAFRPTRALEDPEFMGSLPDQDREVVDRLLRRCVIDDLEGNLIARGNRSIPRKSVVEFGWVVGLPEVTRTESYFHIRYAPERGAGEEVEQPIFHRPASSGVYAVVATLEVARIGFNDITQEYALEEGERERRYRALLESLLYTFVEPNGAMRGTQNPHILDFQGVVTVSREVVPAPLVSPLQEGYREEVQAIADALNRVRGDSPVAVHPFGSLGEFARVMENLLASTGPFRLFQGGTEG